MSSYYNTSSSSSSDSSSDVEEKMENLRVKEDKEINILLLGETGVGKSTFINSIANYVSLKYFGNAEEKGLVKVIPTVYKVQDKNNKLHTIKIGPKTDKNEILKTGESATQNVKTYVFPISHGHVKIRLIDTPGMGDTRGAEQDEINGENIINYIKTLEKIHGICFLYKPTQVRKTTYFDYCVYQVLSLFEKSAAKNICFLFCHTRGSDYGPGDTLAVLNKILKNIEDDTGIKIPLDKDKNVFCFDNEAFRYLGACEKKIEFNASVKERCKSSWIHSARQCWRFIKYLQNDVTPYVPNKLLELNFARKTMVQFSKVLSEVTQLVEDNNRLLERLEDNKSTELRSISQLKTEKTRVTDVLENKMCQPILVCTSIPSCAEVYKVRGVDKWHYKKICHSCYELGNNARMFIAGCPEIVNCKVINKSNRRCNQCGCDFMVHMHVNYITSLQENLAIDDDVSERIATRESLLDSYTDTVDNIKLRNAELQSEHGVIKRFCMNVSRFIRNNAIVAFSDSYKQYIIYLINQAQSSAESSVKASAKDLKRLAQEYEEVEKVFKDASKTPAASRRDLSFDMQDEEFHNLFKLSHKGDTIKMIYQNQKVSASNSSSVKEYVHSTYFVKEKENRNRNTDQRGRQDSGSSRPYEQHNRPNTRNPSDYPPRPDSRNSAYDYPARSDSRNSAYDYPPRPDSTSSTMSYPSDAYGNYPPQHQTHFNYPGHSSYQPREQSSRGGRKSYNVNVTLDARDPRSAPPNLSYSSPTYGDHSGPHGTYGPQYNLQYGAPMSPFLPGPNQGFPPHNVNNRRYPQSQGHARESGSYNNYRQDNRRTEHFQRDQSSNRGRYNKNNDGGSNRRNISRGRKDKEDKRQSSGKYRNKSQGKTRDDSDSSD